MKPVLSIIILLLPGISAAQTITLHDFLESVRQTHPFFARESLSVEIQERSRDRHLGSRDWTVSSVPYYAHEKPTSSSAFSPEEINKAGGYAGLEKVFWKTGGRFSVSASSEYTNQAISDITIPFPMGDIEIPVATSEFYQNKLSVTYSQPILQDFGGKLDRLAYELSQHDVDFSGVQALENQEGFLLDLGTRFLDWAFLFEQRGIARDRLELAEKELTRTKRKRSVNLVRRVDVLRAEDAVRMARQNVMLIESQLKGKQAELAVLAQSRDFLDLDPEFDLYGLEELPDPGTAVSSMRDRSRVIKLLDVRREQLSGALDGFREAVRPQLFLDVGTALQGGDEDFRSSLEFDKPGASVSLLFRYPLGNQTARADIAKTALELRWLEKEMSSLTLDLESRIMGLLVLIEEMEKVLALNEEQIESAARKTGEELRLYRRGQGEMTFVIQSQDNEESAKLAYAHNAANYHKLVLRYRALMDELLP